LIRSTAKLPLALQALGMNLNDTDSLGFPSQGLDLDKFIEVVVLCMKSPNWAANEMMEVFRIFDKDESGAIDSVELRRVFARLGENITETELDDQLREVDIDGDLQVCVSMFYSSVGI
jgi:calmodulin